MHRNSQKRFYNKGHTYFITTKTYQSYPYFEEEIFCELFIEELKLCKKLKGFELYAFGLNYDHFHLVLRPNDEVNISKVMQSIKRNFSRDVNKIISTNEGDIPQCRRPSGIDHHNHIGDNMDYRLQISRDVAFRKVGEKHFKILKNLKQQFIQKHGTSQFKFPKFKWQKSFHDHVIRNQKDFDHHCHYAAYNFIKHQLPENWKYTSLHYPDLIDPS